MEYSGLGDLRVRLGGLSIPTAAREAGLQVERLQAIEAGAPPTVFEIERLAAAYTLDPDVLWDEPIRVSADDSVTVLASLEEFAEVGDLTRARILRVAGAMRDLRTLQALLGETLVPERGTAPARDLPPYEQGAELARQVRSKYSLGVEPIASVRDLVGTRFPWIAVVYAHLGTVGAPAGLGFADSVRGPAIALNLDGKNSNAAVRRFSLAHELGHLLVDWTQGATLASISGFLTDHSRTREQRANGFAVRLLCPETVVQRLAQYRDDDAARVLIEEYGLHYAAARLYLANEAKVYLPQQLPRSLEDIVAPAHAWVEAEAPRGIEDFPIPDAPVERRGVVAQLAAQAYARGLISRDAFGRYVGLTPQHDLEGVTGYYDLDAPEDVATEDVA